MNSEPILIDDDEKNYDLFERMIKCEKSSVFCERYEINIII